jgi:hypothetical protein
MNPIRASMPIILKDKGIDISPLLKIQYKPHTGNEKKIEPNADINLFPKV